MSNKELDHLFKNKLEEFEKNPPQDLWNQIDEQLEPSRKKPIVWFLSIAASIILLFTIGLTILLNEDKSSVENDDLLATNQTSDQVIDKTIKEKELKDKIEAPLVEMTENTTAITDDKAPQRASSENNVPTQNQIVEKEKRTATTENHASITNAQPEVIQPLKAKKEENIILELDQSKNIAQKIEVDATAFDNSTSTSSNGKSIVFDISEFSDKNTVAQNIDEEKKESKLKKLFNIAKDIKQGESGIKNLREAKNDLFALGNKKDENGK